MVSSTFKKLKCLILLQSVVLLMIPVFVGYTVTARDTEIKNGALARMAPIRTQAASAKLDGALAEDRLREYDLGVQILLEASAAKSTALDVLQLVTLVSSVASFISFLLLRRSEKI
jgi:hypothetical protein